MLRSCWLQATRTAALCLVTVLGSAAYLPLRQYEGLTFFDGWAHYGNVDNTTWGNVTYQDSANAVSKRLAFVNEAGNAIVRVDNTTTLQAGAPGEVVNRDSVRLTSLHSYGMGSLIVIDALHIPYGCSVWPAFWSYGIQEEWPLAGEIDIIEAINQMDHNQIALHTRRGCMKADGVTQSGRNLQADCSTNQGCLVAETKPNSFGRGFAEAGGGVYALQMEPTGFNVWFFSRPDVPENLRSAAATSSIDVESWGSPTASFPRTSCDFDEYFKPQTLVLLTTLCGVWAGVPSIYRSTCPGGTGNCFTDGVLGPGSKFDTAYWEIRYIRAYMNENQEGSTTPVDETTTSALNPTITQQNEETRSTRTVTTTIIPQTTVMPNSSSARSLSYGSDILFAITVGAVTFFVLKTL